MYVRVRVYPGCKRESVRKIEDDRYEIQVREPAERNLANQRLRELLAIEFGVSAKTLRLVSGHRSRTKIFDVITN